MAATRILLVDGEPLGAVNRVPRGDEFRSNLAVGGSPQATDLSDTERTLCAELAPVLRAEGLFFVGIAWGDIAWTLAFSILKVSSREPLVAINVAGGYASGFIFGSIGLLSSSMIRRAGFLRSWITLLSVSITLPSCLRTLVLPLIASSHGQLLTVFNLGELVAISSSFVLLNVALTVLFSTRQLGWSIFSAGMVSVIFGDWAMRVEKILGSIPEFGVYELYWTFGVVICAIPFLSPIGRMLRIFQ